MDTIIGMDVSKDTLDVHRLADGSHCQFPNSATGHTKLLKWIKAQLDKRLRHIEADIDKIDAQMLELVRKNQNMAKRMEHLISIPGIGTNTALMILIDLPEIGSLTNKQVGSLAGLAPMSQSSGKWQGKARIMGGTPTCAMRYLCPRLSLSGSIWI